MSEYTLHHFPLSTYMNSYVCFVLSRLDLFCFMYHPLKISEIHVRKTGFIMLY